MRTAALISILIASLVASPIVNKAADLTNVSDIAGVADSKDLEVVDELVCELLVGCIIPKNNVDTNRGGNKHKGEKEILEIEEELDENESLDISIEVEEEKEEEEEINVIITEETDDEQPEQTPPYSKKNHHEKKKTGKKGSRY